MCVLSSRGAAGANLALVVLTTVASSFLGREGRKEGGREGGRDQYVHQCSQM